MVTYFINDEFESDKNESLESFINGVKTLFDTSDIVVESAGYITTSKQKIYFGNYLCASIAELINDKTLPDEMWDNSEDDAMEKYYEEKYGE